MVLLRNYDEDRNKLKSFIEEYYEDSDNEKKFIYKDQILTISKREQNAIYISLDHVCEFDQDLVEAIEDNGLRYQKLMCEAIDEILHEIGEVVIKDAFDIFIDHRIRTEQALRDTQSGGTAQPLTYKELRSKFPPELLRRYEAYFVARKTAEAISIRQILSENIGKVIRLKAVVTRATQVKPLMKIATYTCDRCGSETYQEVINKSFLPLTTCMSESCKAESSRNAGKLHLQTKGSKYVKLQELRVQEVSEQVPVGNIPRNIMVHCVGENTRLVQPGDHVYVTAVYLPMVRVGLKALFQGLTMDMYLDAHSITPISKDDLDDMSAFSQPTETELDQLRDPEMYSLMARSIAPEIFGHEDIKKALLILLAGGSGASVAGTKIRGSLNICLMGDPGVAKSQLLGFVERLSPRSQYTTGRGSSGVGLTASVVKDPLTGEMTLEAGSLVLADGGVCCIDEFDKMAESDRTAIHEVMEQQTISIAKAGIMTTLNARVSILAAANPAYGKYNPSRTIEQNIDLPAALLSRFDLLWLIQDKHDRDTDLRLSDHIAHVHRTNEAPKVSNESSLLSMSELRRYLAVIRAQPTPTIPESLVNYVVGAYVSLRNEARAGSGKETTFTSARTLLALLRISIGLARMRVQREVGRSDIDEAIRLLECSKASVRTSRDRLGKTAGYKEIIYQHIRRLASETGEVRLADVSKKCVSVGFTPDQINEVIDSYEELNVWQINIGRTRLQMVN